MERALAGNSLEDPSPDFLTHLQRRLGISREVALKVLGDWLASYEPVTRRVIEMQARARVRGSQNPLTCCDATR